MITLNTQILPARQPYSSARTVKTASTLSKNVLQQNNTLPSYTRSLSFGNRIGWVVTDKYEEGMDHIEYTGRGDLDEFKVMDFVDARNVDLKVKGEVKTRADFKGTNVEAGGNAEFGDRSELDRIQTSGNLKTYNDVKFDTGWVNSNTKQGGNTELGNRNRFHHLHTINNVTVGTDLQADTIWGGGNIELGDRSQVRRLFAGSNVKLSSSRNLQEVHFVRNPDKKDSGYRKLELESTDIDPMYVYLGNIKKLDIFVKGLKKEKDVQEFADENLTFLYEPETPDSTKKLAKPNTINARNLEPEEYQHINIYGVRYT